MYNVPIIYIIVWKLFTLYRGELIITVNGNKRILKAKQATLVLPFECHAFKTPVGSYCAVAEFTPGMVEEFYSSVKDKLLETAVFGFSNFEKYLTEDITDDLGAKAFLYPFCFEILKQCSFKKRLGTVSDDILVKAMSVISENFKSEEISLTRVADAIGVHPVYLSKIFSKKAGMGFNEYINFLKCNYAISELIETSDKNISEIAFESGFGSIRSFNRTFLKLYGKSPKEYKKDFKPQAES